MKRMGRNLKGRQRITQKFLRRVEEVSELEVRGVYTACRMSKEQTDNDCRKAFPGTAPYPELVKYPNRANRFVSGVRDGWGGQGNRGALRVDESDEGHGSGFGIRVGAL